MSLKDKEKWNAKYGSSACLTGREPGDWLVDHADLLDGRGKALDIAMGEGRNTLFAASLGYDAWGVNISEVGISRAEALARRLLPYNLDLVKHYLAAYPLEGRTKPQAREHDDQGKLRNLCETRG